jgi:hypothetical protein
MRELSFFEICCVLKGDCRLQRQCRSARRMKRILALNKVRHCNDDSS